MIAVRYVALAALVVWLSHLIALTGVVGGPVDLVPYICGGIVLACLIIIKFVGPPPRAFLPRVGIVLVMLAVAAYARFGRAAPSTTSIAIDIVLGAVLLAWYVRE